MRLIDADAFARWLDKEHYVDKPTGKCDDRQNRVLGIAISAAKNPEICPTIDAVPVVRCRDCVYRGQHDLCPMCVRVYLLDVAEYLDCTEDDGFCHRGVNLKRGAER